MQHNKGVYLSLEEYNQPEQWVAQHEEKVKSTNDQHFSRRTSAFRQYVIRNKQGDSKSQIGWIRNVQRVSFLTLVRVISIGFLVKILSFYPQIFKYTLEHSELIHASMVFACILYVAISHTDLGVAKHLNLFLTAFSTVNMAFLINYAFQKIDWKHQEKFIATPFLISLVFLILVGLCTKWCQFFTKQHQTLKQAAISITILCLCSILFFGVNQAVFVALIASLLLLIATQIIEGFKMLFNNSISDVSVKISEILLIGVGISHLLMVFVLIAVDTFRVSSLK